MVTARSRSMKAVPIAQYLDQKARAALVVWSPVRRDPPPFELKTGPAANDSRTQAASIFRRLPRVAAPAARPPESEEQSSNSQGDAEVVRRDSAFFRVREGSPSARDLETQLSEAYHRGVQEGLDTATAEAATARAL